MLDLGPEQAVAVYPNPTHGPLTLDWQHADFALQEVRVYNALGQLVLRQALAGVATDTLPLALDTAGPGLYLVIIQTARGSVTKRVAVH